MRLLNVITIGFEVFYGDPPPYAILSHTWGRAHEEATFQDLRDRTGTNKPGYLKIRACCDQAGRDGLGYVWIDTCCIDKTNSVELQEAINSMFNWYRKSTICYAYLADYDGPGGFVGETFKASKWFTRGWTLQELIAPTRVVFYNRRWVNIGTRVDLGSLISSITRISARVLGGEDLELSSVAQRMSWSSMRKTTRPEDMAYSLLGIFGVHMPLIYGEGGKEAFIRLQKAIMEQSDDQSLFAWKQDYGVVLGAHGLLATTPAMFAHSSSLIRDVSSKNRSAYRMTNRGLEIRLRVTCTLPGGDLIALLHCYELNRFATIGISVAPMKDGRFIRTEPNKLKVLELPMDKKYKNPTFETLYIPQLYLPEQPPQQVFRFQIHEADSNYKVPQKISWVKRISGSILSSSIDKTIPWSFRPALAPDRANRDPSPKGALHVALQVGGRAGVLLVPPVQFISSFPLQMVAVIVGVNLEGLPYGMVVNMKEQDCRSLVSYKNLHRWLIRSSDRPLQLDETGESPWFDKFVLEHPADTPETYVEKEIRGLMFSVEVKQKLDTLASDEKVYSVCISYRPKSEI